MPIDLKAIERLIKLCQRNGVESIEVEGIKLSLTPGAAPQKRVRAKKGAVAPQQDNSPFESDTLTEEQLLNWSVVPLGDSQETN